MKNFGGAWRFPVVLLFPTLAAAARSSFSTPPAATSSNKTVDEFIHGLEGSVLRVMTHLKADRSLKGDEAKERDRITGVMQGALTSEGGVFNHAMALHKALWAAQKFLTLRTKELSQHQQQLDTEIQAQEARILYKMLKQRRRLPMKSQVVLLNRKQFENSTYAKELLQRHTASPPLYKQLENILPKELALELEDSEQKKPKEHLAAAGSEGRVHIVSSRLKNNVKSMEQQLRRAREQLSHLLEAGSVKDLKEQMQARGIVSELDAVLQKAGSTNDLKVQLEEMYGMEKKLMKWMTA